MITKTSLRDLMSYLVDLSIFAAYHQVKNTQPEARNIAAMREVIGALPQIQQVGNTIAREFSEKKNNFGINRIQWEDQKAAEIIGLLKRLRPSIEKLAEEERKASVAGRQSKFSTEGPTELCRINSMKLLNGLIESTGIFESERLGTTRDPGAYRDNPFNGMDFSPSFAATAAQPVR